MNGEQPPPLPPVQPAAPRDDVIMLVLCYLGLLALVPYLAAGREAPLVRFHARQGLALALLGLFSAALAAVPYLGFIGYLGLTGVLILSVLGIVKALAGQEWRAPVAADVADRLQL